MGLYEKNNKGLLQQLDCSCNLI